MQELPIPAISQANLPLVLRPLLQSIALTSVLSHDVAAFLAQHGHTKTAEHCAQVAAEARWPLKLGVSLSMWEKILYWQRWRDGCTIVAPFSPLLNV